MNKKDEEHALYLIKRINELEDQRKKFEEIIAAIRYDSVRPIHEERAKVWAELQSLILGVKK